MSYTNLIRGIKKNKVPPIILLYGTETFFIQEVERALHQHVVQNEQENLSVYDLEEVPIEHVIEDAETYPFFGERKLIVAENPVFLTSHRAKLSFEHDLKRLEQYITSPVDYSVIVFKAPYEKLDNRKKITKLLSTKAEVAACQPIKEHEIIKWVKNIAETLDVSIDKSAYEVFETELTIDLHIIQNELIKMSLYVGEGGTITKEIAESLVSYTLNGSALRLVDAIIDKDLQKALSIYQTLEKMNEEPIALIGLIAFQFRIIYQVKLLQQKGYSQFQMRKQITAHPYVIQIASEREKRFTALQLANFIDLIARTDAKIKRGEMDKSLAFELLVYGLING